jgi:hypothetical protein
MSFSALPLIWLDLRANLPAFFHPSQDGRECFCGNSLSSGFGTFSRLQHAMLWESVRFFASSFSASASLVSSTRFDFDALNLLVYQI